MCFTGACCPEIHTGKSLVVIDRKFFSVFFLRTWRTESSCSFQKLTVVHFDTPLYLILFSALVTILNSGFGESPNWKWNTDLWKVCRSTCCLLKERVLIIKLYYSLESLKLLQLVLDYFCWPLTYFYIIRNWTQRVEPENSEKWVLFSVVLFQTL